MVIDMKGDYELRLNEAKEKIQEILEGYNLFVYGEVDQCVYLICNDNTDEELRLWNGQTSVKDSAT